MIQFYAGDLVRVLLIGPEFGVGIVGRDFDDEVDNSVLFSKFWRFRDEKEKEQRPETVENIELFYANDRFLSVDLYHLLFDYNIIIPYTIAFKVGDYIFPGFRINRGLALARITEIRDSEDRVTKNLYNPAIISRRDRLNIRGQLGKVFLDRNSYFEYNQELDSINVVAPDDLNGRGFDYLTASIWNSLRIVPGRLKDRLGDFTNYSEYSVRGYIL